LKIIRFGTATGDGCYGVLVEDTIHEDIIVKDTILEIEGDIFSDFRVLEDRAHPVQGKKILPPVFPSKIVAVGINYRDHAEEFGHDIPEEPVLFMKPSTSVIGPSDAIIHPPGTKRVDYEAELAVVVKKRAFRVIPEEAGGYILGYTCLNDVTARDLQKKDGQWTRAKSFDTFCPIGPVIQTEMDPDNARIYSRLNGETRQSSSTSNFIFPVFRLFSYVSHVMTLLPGDIVTTGTPSGVGAMKPGDEIEIEIERIGVLRNYVTAGRAFG
jgi:2-keto-4-pentenoate hydratase/2-oxohepta-3-ene-1,7-dioic acid hydratase in catechol pathway